MSVPRLNSTGKERQADQFEHSIVPCATPSVARAPLL
jgi:hypothetical protein